MQTRPPFFIVFTLSRANKGAILHSSCYLKLPLFSSPLVPLSFCSLFLSCYSPSLFTFSAKANIRMFKWCIAKAVFWHIKYFFFFIPVFAYIQLTTHISLNRWGTEEKQSHCFSKIWNIFPNVRIWPYISHTVKLLLPKGSTPQIRQKKWKTKVPHCWFLQ